MTAHPARVDQGERVQLRQTDVHWSRGRAELAKSSRTPTVERARPPVDMSRLHGSLTRSAGDRVDEVARSAARLDDADRLLIVVPDDLPLVRPTRAAERVLQPVFQRAAATPGRPAADAPRQGGGDRCARREWTTAPGCRPAEERFFEPLRPRQAVPGRARAASPGLPRQWRHDRRGRHASGGLRQADITCLVSEVRAPLAPPVTAIRHRPTGRSCARCGST